MAINNPNNEDTDILVTLDLDDGTQAECEILTIFTVDEQDYIALLPLNEKGEPNEDGEVFIYRYFEDEDGNPTLDNIQDDDEYEVRFGTASEGCSDTGYDRSSHAEEGRRFREGCGIERKIICISSKGRRFR